MASAPPARAGPLVSIRTDGNTIEIVDQLLLPHVVEYVKIASVHDAHAAIKTMRVRFMRPICLRNPS